MSFEPLNNLVSWFDSKSRLSMNFEGEKAKPSGTSIDAIKYYGNHKLYQTESNIKIIINRVFSQ